MEMKERAKKLPRWAQNYIHKLESDRRYLQDRLEAGPADSDTFADPLLHPQPLGKGARVRFELSLGQYVEAHISQRRSGLVEVMGSDRVCIEPTAANVCGVRVVG